MIQATELRIGNLVNVENYKYHPKLKNIPLCVSGINPTLGLDQEPSYSISLEHINQKPNTYYVSYSQLIWFIKPIPLTEEWLLKFGFGPSPFCVHGDFQKGYILVRKVNNGDFKNKDLQWTCELNTETDWVDLVKMPYVHQLQNLFFALTGEELTINTK